MRNFSWNYFKVTGDIDAYLLYKTSEKMEQEEEPVDPERQMPDWEETPNFSI